MSEHIKGIDPEVLSKIDFLANSVLQKLGSKPAESKIPQMKQKLEDHMRLLVEIMPPEQLVAFLNHFVQMHEESGSVENLYSIYLTSSVEESYKNNPRVCHTRPTADYIGCKTQIPYTQDDAFWPDIVDIMEKASSKKEMAFSQSLASMAPVWLIEKAQESGDINLKGNVSVLDICAAPGNKSFNLFSILDRNPQIDSLVVLSNDLKPSRAKRISQRLREFGFLVTKTEHDVEVLTHPDKPITYIVSHADGTDSKKLKEISQKYAGIECFDAVIADVHCAGSGCYLPEPAKVVPSSLRPAPDRQGLQAQLLASGLLMTKEAGLLVYSTCSHDPNENEAVPNLFGGETKTILPVDIDNHYFHPSLKRYKEVNYQGEGIRMYGDTMDIGFYAVCIQKTNT